MDDNLQSAINLLNSGKKAEAGAIFARLVKVNPNNEQAWLGLSACVATADQKEYCLKQVIRINPNNELAKKTMASIAFEPKFGSDSAIPARRSTVPRIGDTALQTGLKVAAAILVVFLVILGLFWVWNRTGTDYFIGHPTGYAWNNLDSIEQGGVKVEIARLAVYDKSSLSNEEQKEYQTNAFYGLNTICNLYVKMTNNTDRIMSVYPDQGLVKANSEQVQLISFMFDTSGTTSGQLLPGATVIGTITFGLKNVTPDTISNMTFTFSAPHDEYFSSYGQPYVFNLDLSHHQWLDKPEDLK